jgi:hypothetical protein
MPTIVVETNVCTPGFQRRFTKSVSLWLHSQEVPINHVITKYYNLEAAQIYSGLYAFNNFPCLVGTEAHFAFITCQISQDRSEEFRTAMARAIAQATQPEIQLEYVFINFQPVDPNNYVNGQQVVERELQEVSK